MRAFVEWRKFQLDDQTWFPILIRSWRQTISIDRFYTWHTIQSISIMFRVSHFYSSNKPQWWQHNISNIALIRFSLWIGIECCGQDSSKFPNTDLDHILRQLYFLQIVNSIGIFNQLIVFSTPIATKQYRNQYKYCCKYFGEQLCSKTR